MCGVYECVGVGVGVSCLRCDRGLVVGVYSCLLNAIYICVSNYNSYITTTISIQL